MTILMSLFALFISPVFADEYRDYYNEGTTFNAAGFRIAGVLATQTSSHGYVFTANLGWYPTIDFNGFGIRPMVAGMFLNKSNHAGYLLVTDFGGLGYVDVSKFRFEAGASYQLWSKSPVQGLAVHANVFFNIFESTVTVPFLGISYLNANPATLQVKTGLEYRL